MQITQIIERTVPIASPMRNAVIDFSQMTSSIVAVITDVIRDGSPVIGYGFNSNGRYAQGEILRERILPRLEHADRTDVIDSDREAVRATYIGGVACLPIWIMFMLIGAGIWGYFQLSSVSLPAELTNDQIVPWFIRNECPQGMLGLIVAALMAAAMSSLAADMNSLATVVVDDFFAKIKPAATDNAKLWVGRVMVVLTGLAAVYFSQQWIGVESAMKLVVDLLLITTGGMLGLFALGLLTTRATNIGAWIGIAACVLFTSWATLTSLRLPSMDGPVLDLGALNWAFETSLIGILGHFILFGVGFVASLVLGRVNPDVLGLTIRGQGSGEAAGSS